MVIASNKIDLEANRVVPEDDARILAEEKRINLHKTSAKTGEGVDAMVQDILSQVYY